MDSFGSQKGKSVMTPFNPYGMGNVYKSIILYGNHSWNKKLILWSVWQAQNISDFVYLLFLKKVGYWIVKCTEKLHHKWEGNIFLKPYDEQLVRMSD